MASSMNLTPNIWVILIQFIIFVVNIVIVKSLILKPYFMIKAKRDEQTVLLKERTNQLKEANQRSFSQLEASLKEAQIINKNELDQAKQKLVQQQSELIQNAKKQANDQIQEFKKDLDKDFNEQKTAINSLVSKVGDELYAKLLT